MLASHCLSVSVCYHSSLWLSPSLLLKPAFLLLMHFSSVWQPCIYAALYNQTLSRLVRVCSSSPQVGEPVIDNWCVLTVLTPQDTSYMFVTGPKVVEVGLAARVALSLLVSLFPDYFLVSRKWQRRWWPLRSWVGQWYTPRSQVSLC